jgi:ankyrin repeat protein
MNVQMGDLIPRKTSPVAEHQHPVIEGSPRRGSYGSVDLRFEALSVQTRDGSYPLHMAVSNRSSLHVLDMLINAGPEVVFWTNKHGETPLHLALRGRLDDEAVEFLLFADKNNRALEIAERRGGNLPLHLAVVNGSLSIVVQLLTRFPHAVCVPNSDGELPIALAKGNEHLVDILLVSDEADYQKDIDTFSKLTDDGTMSKVTDDEVIEVGSAMSVDSVG